MPFRYRAPATRALGLLAFWTALWCAAPAPADAQEVPSAAAERRARSAGVTQIAEPISVDGVLNEPAWTSAPAIGELVQREPATGEPPTERTVVTLLHDADNLYIGVVAHDSEPERIIGSVMARDASVNADDRIEILLDTFGDQRSAFYFATNPVGVFVDGLVVGDAQVNTDWDAIWEVRTQRTTQGWIAEFSIPFKSLSFPTDRRTWGFNIGRIIHRKLEDTRWSGANLRTPFRQVSEAGEVTFQGAPTQGVGLDVRPFLAGNWLHTQRTGADDFNRKPGLDLFYNLTPSLKLTATVNTDFGETEVDARQINLNRFSVFFPEKRAFFLEGAGVFGFASTGPAPAPGMPQIGADVYPFFSRQIGLFAGQEVPLDAGLKLTGTVGRTDVGLLGVRAGSLDGVVDERSFVVGRVKQSLLRESYVGVLFTSGHPGFDRSAQTFGLDMRLATSRFLGRPRNAVLNAYAARSVNEGISSRDWSYGFSAEYPNDRYVAQVALREIQENFQPALGFVQRRNVRVLRGVFSFNPRPKDFLNIQQLFHDVYLTQYRRLDNGEIESWDLAVTWIDWHFWSGDGLHGLGDLNVMYEQLFEPFEISPGVVLPPGEYKFIRSGGTITTANKRNVSGRVNIRFGEFWSGHSENVTANLTLKLPPRFSVAFDVNQTFARLAEGRFKATILSANGSLAFSPFLSFSNLVQYDNRSRNLGWQSRARWTLNPGNDLFVSFQQGWLHELVDEETGATRELVPVRGDRRFTAQQGKLSAKFQYSFRF